MGKLCYESFGTGESYQGKPPLPSKSQFALLKRQRFTAIGQLGLRGRVEAHEYVFTVYGKPILQCPLLKNRPNSLILILLIINYIIPYSFK